MSSVLAAVSCTVDQCRRWSARRAAAVLAARSCAKPRAITSSASLPPRCTSCHSNRESSASTTAHVPPAINAVPRPIPGLSAAPTTSATPSPTAESRPDRAGKCHCIATAPNETTGVIQPPSRPVSSGATSNGWASASAQSTPTSAPHSTGFGAVRVRQPYQRLQAAKHTETTTHGPTPIGGPANGAINAQSTPTTARPTPA
jgi:hypothetical protein